MSSTGRNTSNRSDRTYSADCDASVLIVVIWACLGLVALVLVFGQAMAMNYRGAGNDLAARQADAAIEGAVRYAKYILSNVDTPGLFPDPTTYQYEAVPVGDATFWFLGGDSQDALDSRPFGLVDEASKLNVNSGNVNATVLQLLPGMTSDFASAIVAWRTPAGSGSSLSGSVSGLDGNTYTPKYAPFETPEEIGMVNGADKTFLYGEDANLNGALDPNEDDGDKTLPSDNSDGKLDPGLLSFLTTFSREPNTQPDGTPRLDIRRPLQAAGAFRNLLANIPTLASQTAAILSHFQPDTQIRSVMEFYDRSGLKADQFAPLARALSTTAATEKYISGLVNVNTASQEVLAAIPGIGTDLAATLIATRTSRTTQDTNIAWAADILKANPGAVAQAGPYLTGASFQACVDVAAVGRDGRGYRRTRFVIDTSTGPPRIIYRRDLTNLGWALGSDIRQKLADNKGSLAPR